jgi:hypothetical protein
MACCCSRICAAQQPDVVPFHLRCAQLFPTGEWMACSLWQAKHCASMNHLQCRGSQLFMAFRPLCTLCLAGGLLACLRKCQDDVKDGLKMLHSLIDVLKLSNGCGLLMMSARLFTWL